MQNENIKTDAQFISTYLWYMFLSN